MSKGQTGLIRYYLLTIFLYVLPLIVLTCLSSSDVIKALISLTLVDPSFLRPLLILVYIIIHTKQCQLVYDFLKKFGLIQLTKTEEKKYYFIFMFPGLLMSFSLLMAFFKSDSQTKRFARVVILSLFSIVALEGIRNFSGQAAEKIMSRSKNMTIPSSVFYSRSGKYYGKTYPLKKSMFVMSRFPRALENKIIDKVQFSVEGLNILFPFINPCIGCIKKGDIGKKNSIFLKFIPRGSNVKVVSTYQEERWGIFGLKKTDYMKVEVNHSTAVISQNDFEKYVFNDHPFLDSEKEMIGESPQDERQLIKRTYGVCDSKSSSEQDLEEKIMAFFNDFQSNIKILSIVQSEEKFCLTMEFYTPYPLYYYHYFAKDWGFEENLQKISLE